jgi:hypothetical protein
LPAGTRYTNRHEAPKRPHWLPDEVPYKYVRPSPAVDEAWKAVLGKYGVAGKKTETAAAPEPASTEGASIASAEAGAGAPSSLPVPSGAYTAATRYAKDDRGAGAVGWLAKVSSTPVSSPSSGNGAEIALTPTSAADDVIGSEHHWFASQLGAPEHEMGLQAYFVRLPHPTRPGMILTVQQELPRHWDDILRDEDGGNQGDQQQ